jgi:hypothetical protein
MSQPWWGPSKSSRSMSRIPTDSDSVATGCTCKRCMQCGTAFVNQLSKPRWRSRVQRCSGGYVRGIACHFDERREQAESQLEHSQVLIAGRAMFAFIRDRSWHTALEIFVSRPARNLIQGKKTYRRAIGGLRQRLFFFRRFWI